MPAIEGRSEISRRSNTCEEDESLLEERPETPTYNSKNLIGWMGLKKKHTGGAFDRPRISVTNSIEPSYRVCLTLQDQAGGISVKRGSKE